MARSAGDPHTRSETIGEAAHAVSTSGAGVAAEFGREQTRFTEQPVVGTAVEEHQVVWIQRATWPRRDEARDEPHRKPQADGDRRGIRRDLSGDLGAGECGPHHEHALADASPC